MDQYDATGLVYVCMTHVPLWIDLPSFVQPLCLGGAQADGQFNLRDWAPHWEPYHPVLGATIGSFALRNYLLGQPEAARRVGICQYRKFVSRHRISGIADKGIPAMDLVDKAVLGSEVIAPMLWPGDTEFLLCQPMNFRRGRRRMDILEQYNRVHCAEDLLRFTAEAVAQGVIEKKEASTFLHDKMFFIGGLELGIYPAEFWIRSVGAIEQVVHACVRRYPEAREGPQARSWAFCVERLGSYLLLKHFRQSGVRYRLAMRHSWAQRILCASPFIGQLNLITERPGERYVAGT